MPTGRQDDETYLKLTRSGAKSVLSRQIDEGQDLMADAEDYGGAEELMASFENWDEANKGAIRRVFSGANVMRKYLQRPRPSIDNDQSDEIMVGRFDDAVRRVITILETLRDEVELYDRPAS